MFIKRILAVVFLFVFIGAYAVADETIKAENNAYRHNNKGLIYVREKYYFGAIKEFKIAIDLNPNTQAAAVYYTNLANTYSTIGYHDLAKPCFEKAVVLDVLCFENYLNLAKNYKKLNIAAEKIAEFSAKTDSPLNAIMVGLLYIQDGNRSTGITILDEFCNAEPNLLITKGVKNYIKELGLKS